MKRLRSLLFACWALPSLWGWGPLPPASPHVQWVQGTLWVWGEPSECAFREGPDGQILEKLCKPPGTFSLFWVGDRCWAITASPETLDGAPTWVTRAYVREGQSWKAEARWAHPAGPLHLVPLQNGDFLAINDHRQLQDEQKKAYPLAILRPGPSKKLEIKSLHDFGFPQPFFKATRAAAPQRGFTYPAFTADFLSPEVHLTEQGLCLVAKGASHLFVLDPLDGKLRKTIPLFKSVDESWLLTRDLAAGILIAQPRPNGHLLVASRTEDAVLQAGRAYRETLPPIQSDQDYIRHRSKIQTLFELNLTKWPLLQWWDVDLETGTVRPEEPPLNFPDRIPNRTAYLTYAWRYKADGNLLWLGGPTPAAP